MFDMRLLHFREQVVGVLLCMLGTTLVALEDEAVSVFIRLQGICTCFLMSMCICMFMMHVCPEC
jgi:hypothetical protein